jgi:hypothetical protein
MKSPDNKFSQSEDASCTPALSRKKFMAMVLKRAAIAGAVLAAPKIVDKFLVPPAQAMMLTSTRLSTEA